MISAYFPLLSLNEYQDSSSARKYRIEASKDQSESMFLNSNVLLSRHSCAGRQSYNSEFESKSQKFVVNRWKVSQLC